MCERALETRQTDKRASCCVMDAPAPELVGLQQTLHYEAGCLVSEVPSSCESGMHNARS